MGVQFTPAVGMGVCYATIGAWGMHLNSNEVAPTLHDGRRGGCYLTERLAFILEAL